MENLSLYTKLIEEVNLEDIFIKDLKVTRNPIPITEDLELHVDVKMNPELEVYNEENIIASVKFEVTAQKDEEIFLFSLNFEYVVIYTIDDVAYFISKDLTEAATLFVKRNVPINVWPFARELVADMSNRINVPRLLIGMYRYIPHEEEKDND